MDAGLGRFTGGVSRLAQSRASKTGPKTMSDAVLTARSAFADLFVAPAGRGLVATERDGLGIASVSVRRGQRTALQDRVVAHFGILLPDRARRVTKGAISAAGTGPGTWLLIGENTGSALIPSLKSAVGATASVADQSDAYAILRLSGPTLRETLAKLVPLDLHPRAFSVGDVAATLVAQIGALLWRIDDAADGQPIIELAVYRSMAASLWHELLHHAAERAG
jgi:heterotetrameric sarcosine oxidase gamma subunit